MCSETDSEPESELATVSTLTAFARSSAKRPSQGTLRWAVDTLATLDFRLLRQVCRRRLIYCSREPVCRIPPSMVSFKIVLPRYSSCSTMCCSKIQQWTIRAISSQMLPLYVRHNRVHSFVPAHLYIKSSHRSCIFSFSIAGCFVSSQREIFHRALHPRRLYAGWTSFWQSLATSWHL